MSMHRVIDTPVTKAHRVRIINDAIDAVRRRSGIQRKTTATSTQCILLTPQAEDLTEPLRALCKQLILRVDSVKEGSDAVCADVETLRQTSRDLVIESCDDAEEQLVGLGFVDLRCAEILADVQNTVQTRVAVIETDLVRADAVLEWLLLSKSQRRDTSCPPDVARWLTLHKRSRSKAGQAIEPDDVLQLYRIVPSASPEVIARLYASNATPHPVDPRKFGIRCKRALLRTGSSFVFDVLLLHEGASRVTAGWRDSIAVRALAQELRVTARLLTQLPSTSIPTVSPAYCTPALPFTCSAVEEGGGVRVFVPIPSAPTFSSRLAVRPALFLHVISVEISGSALALSGTTLGAWLPVIQRHIHSQLCSHVRAPKGRVWDAVAMRDGDALSRALLVSSTEEASLVRTDGVVSSGG
jgi:hypothetical protein